MEIHWYLSISVTLVYMKDVNSVKLMEDSIIPPHALRGHQAVLRCNYDLEGDNLYSVKWYYNQKEFYRYIPSDNPRVTIFNHHHSVRVNPRLSTEQEIVLDDVSFETTGHYRCEVSGDAPMFQTASNEGILYVVDLPDHGPEVIGGQPRYNVGDLVNVTCISRNSLPAALLSWYINGEKADRSQLRSYPEQTSQDGLKTSMLGLVMRVTNQHFVNGDMKLKCTATISTVYWKSNEESVQGSGFHPPRATASESRGLTSAATRHNSGDGLENYMSGIPNDHHLYGWSINRAAKTKMSYLDCILLAGLFSQVLLWLRTN